MGLWLCSYVAMWLYGYAAKFQIFRILEVSNFRNFESLEVPEFQNSKLQKLCAHNFNNIKFWILKLANIICFKDVAIYFLIFFEDFVMIKAINTGLQGLGNQEIMKNQDFHV